MRIPQRPPIQNNLYEWMKKHPESIQAIYEASAKARSDGKYLHWDKLRHLKPPDELTSEEWWASLKLVRRGLMKGLPLKDLQGRQFKFGLPDPAPEILHGLARDTAGQIQIDDKAITSPEARDRYVVRSLIEEAITSSQLEGASTTRQVAKQMIRTRRHPKDTDERMILNNYLAMEKIRRLKDKPLTPEIVFELHRVLTQGTLDDPTAAGRFRRNDEDVRVYDDRDNEVLHTPPPAHELSDRLQALCDFANAKAFMDPTIRAIILHFWLAYDHPFVDGNGRCARALFYWSMLRQGYWLFEFLSISEIIRKAPAKYVRAFLYTETDENDVTYFILYHLEVIGKSIKKVNEYFARKTKEIKQIEGILRTSVGFNYRQLAILSHALRHPHAEYTVKSHQTSHNVVHRTARQDLYDLAERGLLLQNKVKKTFYFTPAPDFEQRLKDLGNRS